MALTLADVPGATLLKEGAESTGDRNIADAYTREFTFTSPYGASKYIYLADEVLVATSLAKAAAEYKAAGHEFSSASGQRALLKEFTSGIGKANVKSTTRVKPHALKIADSGMEVGMVVHTTHGPINISVSLFRVGKVVVFNVAAGRGSAINAADARKLGGLGVTHISAALVPISVTVPTVTGTAGQGQTLSGSNGTWGDEPTSFTYQWQHCDSSGANCTSVAGATGATYAVTSADVGFTLRLSVTAANKYGSTAAVSAPTAVVS
jgi:hypothetical protein